MGKDGNPFIDLTVEKLHFNYGQPWILIFIEFNSMHSNFKIPRSFAFKKKENCIETR